MFKFDNTPNKIKNPINDENTTALFNVLKAKEATPNIIPLDQFRQFEVLFRQKSLTSLNENQVKTLTERYLKLVDVYKSTHIIKSLQDPIILLTLPAIFVPVRSFDHTPQNSALVATNQAMAHNTVPKYQADAFGAMFVQFQHEQLKNKKVIQEYSADYAKLAREFFDKYPNKSTNNTTSDSQPTSLDDDQTEWIME